MIAQAVAPVARTDCYADPRELGCPRCGHVTQPPAEWASAGGLVDVRAMRASEDMPRYCARCGAPFDPDAVEAAREGVDPSAWDSYWE